MANGVNKATLKEDPKRTGSGERPYKATTGNWRDTRRLKSDGLGESAKEVRTCQRPGARAG